MLETKYNFKVEEQDTVAFVRLLGRFGFKFEMSDVRLSNTCLGMKPAIPYRVFKVTASPWKMKKFNDAIKLLAEYCLR
ncbi:MAG: hypothetical protein IJZ39_07135 [Oscillospiraceae bacterium]|nr:hypothetical protein [Oscillospiraceae bacterium]